MLLLAFLISVGTSVWGQEDPVSSTSKTVNLNPTEEQGETGTQGKTLAVALGDEANSITELKIIGPLTAEDFSTLKNMQMLQVLDMGEVSELPKESIIIEGETKERNIIPQAALENNYKLSKVVLPQCIEVLKYRAFGTCTSLATIDFSKATELKEIGASAFSKCSSLSLIDLSNCTKLITIYSEAFAACNNLKEIDLSGCTNLKTIGRAAFSSCSLLNKVDLTNCSSLCSIDQEAFYSCKALSSFLINESVGLSDIKDRAFWACEALNNFGFQSLSQLKSIGISAFASTGLNGKIVFGTGLQQIGNYAFENTGIEVVDFMACTALSSISKLSLILPELKEIKINNQTYLSDDGILYNKEKTELIYYPANKEGTEFRIPNTVAVIGSEAFYLMKQLKQITVPNSVTSIGQRAFGDAYNRLSVIFENQTPIGLPNDIGLSEALVYVPKGSLESYKRTAVWQNYTLIETGAEGTTVELTSAGTLASKLTGVDLGTIQDLKVTGRMNASDFEVIKQMTLLTKVDLSGATMEENKLPDRAFSSYSNDVAQLMAYLKEVILPEGITEIGSSAFSYLYQLEKVSIPTTVERIGTYAFAQCHRLNSLDVSSLTHLKSIGSSAFAGCSFISSTLRFPNTLESIGQYAFRGTNATSVDFSNTTLNRIEAYAFSDCAITGNLSFPATLTYIGNGAFDAATPSSIKLKSAEMVSLGSTDVFKKTDKTTCKVHVPKGLGKTYKADTYWSPFVKIMEYGNLVVTSVNNSNYGSVNGGGAYEKDEQVTLSAVFREDYWDWQTYVHLFAGWYEGDNRVGDDITYTFAMGETDKAVSARFERIYFESSNKSDFPLSYTDRTDKSITVTVDLSALSNDQLYYGWYDNNDQLITKEASITVQAGNGDRIYTARISGSSTNIYDTKTVNDANKVDGQEILLVGNLTVTGSNEWALKGFTFRKDASLLVESPMSADNISLIAYLSEREWYFISFPYDFKLTDMKRENGAALRQFVVREYDGASRALNGMGSSWKQLASDGVMKANKGYIIQFAEYSTGVAESYNATSGMDALFNRSAVTIPLPAHTSTAASDANWNLVGNPFPCYFSVKRLFDDGLDGTVTVWSDRIQNYEYYTKDDAGVYLAPLTAFFIQHNQASSVTFKPEGRVAALPTICAAVADLRSDDGREVINLQLANDSLSDKTRVVFNEAASTDYELGKDAAKFSSMNTNAPSLYTFDAQNQQLAINERPVGNGVVRLGCYIGVKGSYTLSAKEALASDLYLFDTETGASCNLRETSYTFTAEAGVCNDRFELHTSLKGTGVEAIEGFSWQVTGDQLQLNGLPAGAQVNLFDASGRMLFASDAATATQGIPLTQSGIYYLTIRTAEGRSFTVSIKR